jgi:phosphomannomutase/phosphoglucomutase
MATSTTTARNHQQTKKEKPIISVSGIRGVVNETLTPSFAEAAGARFGMFLRGGTVAIASDTRTSHSVIKPSVLSGLVASGCRVYDLGFSSTPSVFKEVAVRGLDGGIVVTASHNPPEWNGIKFVARGGRGIFESELKEIMSLEPRTAARFGSVSRRRPSYLEIIAARAGKDAAKSVKVALDLAGGVGCYFIPRLLSFQGCEVHSIHDSPGIFPRTIDPTVDPLDFLSNTVREASCDAGFAYDCDADRLVIVDEKGNKLSGDATLLICLRYFLENTRNRTVAVSVDTSLAAEDLVREYNGKVIYAKVGEANVLRQIIENNCGAGGEGSSGGYIEPAFVMCRDGVYGSTIITRMIKSEGSLSNVLSNFKTYFQARGKNAMSKETASLVLQKLASDADPDKLDLTDGLKIRTVERSWVLIRYSNTENVMRISAEARSKEEADRLASDYSSKITNITQVLSETRK